MYFTSPEKNDVLNISMMVEPTQWNRSNIHLLTEHNGFRNSTKFLMNFFDRDAVEPSGNTGRNHFDWGGEIFYRHVCSWTWDQYKTRRRRANLRFVSHRTLGSIESWRYWLQCDSEWWHRREITHLPVLGRERLSGCGCFCNNKDFLILLLGPSTLKLKRHRIQRWTSTQGCGRPEHDGDEINRPHPTSSPSSMDVWWKIIPVVKRVPVKRESNDRLISCTTTIDRFHYFILILKWVVAFPQCSVWFGGICGEQILGVRDLEGKQWRDFHHFWKMVTFWCYISHYYVGLYKINHIHKCIFG